MADTENSPPIFNAIRDLERDNAALRLKLARHEFRQLERELKSEQPFKLDVYTQADPVSCELEISEITDTTLPRLPVPMGTIHADHATADLPIIGVHDDGLTGSTLAAALMGLMNTQYHSPFARLVFLCSSFEAVPLLGRYGFAFEQIGRVEPATVLGRLNRRYGATQIRAIGTGAVITENPDR